MTKAEATALQNVARAAKDAHEAASRVQLTRAKIADLGMLLQKAKRADDIAQGKLANALRALERIRARSK